MSSTEPATDAAQTPAAVVDRGRPAGSAPPGRGRWRHPKQTTAVSVAYVGGLFMSTMDMHIVNVALPTLGRDFHASVASVQWTVLAYLLTLAVVIPASGWIGDRIGNKRTFLIALATFTVASALCGLAQNLSELIAFRALQGIGGGAMTPMGTAMLYRALPARAPGGGGPHADRAGPGRPRPRPGGGRCLHHLPVVALGVPGQRAVRSGHAPLRADVSDRGPAVARGPARPARTGALRGRPQPRPLRGQRGVGSGLGLAQIIATLIVGVVALAAFVRRSRHRADPLLRLHLLSDRLFTATLITSGLGLAAFLGSLYLIPIFLQEALHQSPIGSGLTTFVEAIGVVVASQTIGRFYPRLGPRVLAGVSGLVQTVLLGSFVLVGPGTSLWWIRAVMFLAGMANSGLILSTQASMFTNVSRADTAHASAIYNTERQVAIALGVAVLTTIVAGVGTPILTAYHAAFGADAALALLGALAALTLIRTADARITMRPRRT